MRADRRKSKKKKSNNTPFMVLGIILGIICAGAIVYGGVKLYIKLNDKPANNPDIVEPVDPGTTTPDEPSTIVPTGNNVIAISPITIYYTQQAQYGDITKANDKVNELIEQKIISAVVETDKKYVIGGIFLNEEMAIKSAQKSRRVNADVKLFKKEISTVNKELVEKDAPMADIINSFSKDMEKLINLKIETIASFQKNRKYEITTEIATEIKGLENELNKYRALIDSTNVSSKTKSIKKFFNEKYTEILAANITTDNIDYKILVESVYKQADIYMTFAMNCK